MLSDTYSHLWHLLGAQCSFSQKSTCSTTSRPGAGAVAGAAWVATPRRSKRKKTSMVWGVGSPKKSEQETLKKLAILICHTARWLLYAQPKVNSQWQVESGSQAPAPKVNYRHARPPGFLPACRGRVVWKAAPNHMHSSHPEVISTVLKVADYLRPSSSLNLMSESQFEKVFLPPGTGFLRRNFPNMVEDFPNIEEKFSSWTFLIFIIFRMNFPNFPNELS